MIDKNARETAATVAVAQPKTNPPVGDADLIDDHLAVALLAASPDCVKLLSTDGSLNFMSHAGLCAMEIADVSTIQGALWWHLWPATEADKLRNAVDRANAGEHTRFEAYCPTTSGTPKWWDVTVGPLFAPDGALTQVLAVSRDITDLRDRTARLESALAQSQMLRREVDHRVKNSLGIVSSLLSMQARKVNSDVAAGALREASMRVQTIATVHDRLHHTEALRDLRLDEYLRMLCDDIAGSVGVTADIGWSGDPAPVTVPPDTLVAIGLIMSELISNAVRHGRAENASVVVRVALTQPGPDRVTLVVADDGPGLAPGFDAAQSTGMGMLVVLTMAQKIDAHLGFGVSALGGAAFTLSYGPTTAP